MDRQTGLPSAKARGSRARQVIRRLLVLAAVVIVCYALFPWVLYGLAEYRVGRELAGLRRAGYPVADRELIVAKVPEAQNAAATYKQLVGNQWRRKVYELRWEGPPWDGAAARKKGLTRIRQMLKLLGPRVNQVREASNRPYCRLPVDATRLGAESPYQNTGLAAYALSANALVLAAEGEASQAYRDLAGSLRVARQLVAEPMAWDEVQTSVMAAIWALPEVMRAIPPDERQARELAGLLDEGALGQGYVRWLVWQRALALTALELVKTRPQLMYERFSPDYEYEGRAPIAWAHDTCPCMRLRACQDQLTLLHAYREGLAAAQNGRLSGVEVQKKMEAAERNATYRHPYAEFVAASFLTARYPFPGQGWTGVERMQAAVVLARDALALERYRQRRGEYPAALTQAAGELGQALGKDPYRGKPPHYQRRGSGYLLYCVGENGRDDGGIVGAIPGKKGQRGDDVTWPALEEPG